MVSLVALEPSDRYYGHMTRRTTATEAKAKILALLDEVAAGREVVITSDGKPKARLVPMDASAQRKPFQGTREHLLSMPKWRGGPTAEELVRDDRDSRGW